MTHLRKEKTAKLIPNAILICTKAEKVRAPCFMPMSLTRPQPDTPLTPSCCPQHFFTSFGARDRCFDLIHGLWINAQLGKVPEWGQGEREARGVGPKARLGRGPGPLCLDLGPGSQTLSPRELRRILHQGYGAELGLTSEDDDYVAPTLG